VNLWGSRFTGQKCPCSIVVRDEKLRLLLGLIWNLPGKHVR